MVAVDALLEPPVHVEQSLRPAKFRAEAQDEPENYSSVAFLGAVATSYLVEPGVRDTRCRMKPGVLIVAAPAATRVYWRPTRAIYRRNGRLLGSDTAADIEHAQIPK